MEFLNKLPLILSVVVTIWTIVLCLSLGQGGDRLKLDDDKETSMDYDIDDDSLWKLANSIYYNPDDSSIFLEKRVGVGWTVNAGRPFGMAFMILPSIIIVSTLFFIK